jgi:hypothetical protein
MSTDKIEAAIAELAGHPIKDLCEALTIGVEMQRVLLIEFKKDGELSDEELEKYRGALEVQMAAVEYETELRESAKQAAAGHASDKNNAEKI